MRTRIRKGSTTFGEIKSGNAKVVKKLEDINNKLGAIVILLTQLKEGN